MPLSSYVSTTSGQKVLVAEGTRLVFGRGPGVDLIIAAGRGLSRRAGLVTAMAAGVWIANISRTHATPADAPPGAQQRPAAAGHPRAGR